MGVIGIDRRSEARLPADLAIVVWGIDTAGERFVEQARAQNISVSGALLTAFNVPLRPGDVIGVLYGGQRARFRVVWVRYDGLESPMQAAVHRIDPDLCPWLDVLWGNDVVASAPTNVSD